jgi:hypothetical protein
MKSNDSQDDVERRRINGVNGSWLGVCAKREVTKENIKIK